LSVFAYLDKGKAIPVRHWTVCSNLCGEKVSELLRGTLLIVIIQASCNTSHHAMLFINQGLNPAEEHT